MYENSKTGRFCSFQQSRFFLVGGELLERKKERSKISLRKKDTT